MATSNPAGASAGSDEHARKPAVDTEPLTVLDWYGGCYERAAVYRLCIADWQYKPAPTASLEGITRAQGESFLVPADAAGVPLIWQRLPYHDARTRPDDNGTPWLRIAPNIEETAPANVFQPARPVEHKDPAPHRNPPRVWLRNKVRIARLGRFSPVRNALGVMQQTSEWVIGRFV